ncbi:MAG TPA: DNA topoisomerase IV subunit B [Bacteroidales bacterium]|nr:DNA topoisomerase IV subunit B [Bacteroidales bacterium]
MTATYNEDSIKTLEWQEHIRKRPGMYIGKLGSGVSYDDGIYILIKEVIDNSVDEFAMGFGKKVEVKLDGKKVSIRDYGRGIPLGKLADASSKMNTGAKYDSKVFKKAVGLNGVGIKAVNALSREFIISAFREGQTKEVVFEQGHLKSNEDIKSCNEKNGTLVEFIPDEDVFGEFDFQKEYIAEQLRNYVFLNSGLTIEFNGDKFFSRNGLLDLLQDKMNQEPLYPIIHLQDEDIELAITHAPKYGEEYYSFVNGQYTPQGGTHLTAFKESIVRTIKEFYQKNFEASDIRTSIVAAFSLKVEEPVFESQTKTKLGSKDMGPKGPTIRTFVNDFIKHQLDDYLHKNQGTADILLKKIQNNEKERKAISGIKKIARERAKKVSLHNKKLRDCRVHLNTNHEKRLESSIFITEGDSASGSITKARDVNTQAVFSLRGKPLNSFALTKKVVYENEEFNLLQAALNIEEGIENLRYRNVIIATDADVDGMHIRLLLITFFLQFFPDLIKNGNLFILQTPLFRVRNKKDTHYCYSEEERDKAVRKLKGKAEVTRFKGLGEISPGEFKYFITEGLRLEQVKLTKQDEIKQLLRFYMGKNTPDRQEFIIENLRNYEEIID